MRRVITLLTDFGLLDPYPALMKGVILNINPEATIIDISHSIDKFNVKMGAFILAYAVNYFPESSIHVAVVDPGVGTARKPLIVKCSKGYLIGPDNGLLMPAAEKLGLKEAYEIDVDKVSIGCTSQTFHGRDVFAPAAARISKGEMPDLLGKPYDGYVKLTLPAPKMLDKCILGEVLYVNGFGNIITNVEELTVKALNIKTGDLLLVETAHGSFRVKFVNSYGAVEPGSPLAIINSFRRLELAVNLGDGSRFFQLKAGDSINISIVNDISY
ncbi:MAG: S-adenosyl-l-methionine hydroxide adenosyltransferase family protein [Thermoproteota archaeon]|nr:S-adenosyl-l-methionine hydroxide adenosyltransferase family protein [Candidatus Bathyarchaeota archaeon]